jgi:serine/threonine protein kinase/tetratricopeptide (TPR) repeat protein
MSEDKPRVAGRYQLEQLIGRGGMGDVYRGIDAQTGEEVAVKLLHESIVEDNPDIVDRFRREGEALRKLDHPNIVKLLDTVEENGRHYLVMEYVGGGSLRDLIDEHARLPLEAVLNIALDLADALTRAHRLNVIHRDIKPDNVLLAEDGTPRLTDFGVAHLGDRTRLTQTGSVIGTYAYLSPEACNGLELDERADIWSFGIMLFEMLTGRVPFHESGTAAILTAILTRPAPDITRLRPGLPEPLTDLICRMLEKERDRRIPSVRLVGAELEVLIRGVDTPLRDLVLPAGSEPGDTSRFATPSDENNRVPAMVRSTPQQTHGLSLYPSPPPTGAQPASHAAGMMVTPGGTPITAETLPAVTKWKWIALMVIVTVLACSAVAVIAILSGPESGKDETQDQATSGAGVIPPPGGSGAEPGTQPVVEPVAPGEYMVLVAELEPLAGADPDATPARFIAADLKQVLEETVPYSNIRVRTYPAVVISDDQARRIAEEVGATVVVWGNTSADLIEVEVQMGATTAFPYLKFQRDLVERTVNVRLHMTDPQRESIAPYVLNVLNILQNADGNAFEALRIGAIEDVVAGNPAEIVGNTVAANMHRAIMSNDPQEALARLKDALSLDAGNALLYIYSSVIKQREGLVDDARRDALTAQRIGPPDWSLPLLVTAAMGGDETVIDLFNQVIQQRPDDWFPYFFRGTIYYEMRSEFPGALDLAKADLDAAVALKPSASFPYIYSALLALHEGRITDAGQAINLVLTEFPDPDFMRRLLLATFGDETLNLYSLTLSAFTNLTLGQYTAVIEDSTVGIERYPDQGDAYLLQGVAYCGLGDYATAEASFSGGLEHDPEFVLLHLLRADTRLQQDNVLGAEEDFAAIGDSALSAEFVPLIQAVKDRQLSCTNFFSPENPVFSAAVPAVSIPIPAEALAAVEPVEPGQYMVLVADIEPLEGVPPRDVARFVAEDLRRTFEEEIPLSGIGVRQYPALVTSSEQARAVAAAAGAGVIVWGYYTAEQIELEVQVGVTDAFPHIQFSRATLERTANVRVRLTNERQESVALQILGVLNVLANADGDEFNTISAFMLANSVHAPGGEIVGNSAAAHIHRALAVYASDTARAVDEFSAAMVVDSGNVLPYAYRALAYMRIGDEQGYRADLETMRRLGPENWTTPLFMSAEDMTLTALQSYKRLAELRPDDWFVYFLRGVFYYYGLNDLDKAKADFEQSIALKPAGNLPYISALIIALRQGRMADAQNLARTILTEFPDPELTNRALQAVYGDSVEHDFTGAFFAAATNFALGQYDDVAERIQSFADYLFSQIEAGIVVEQEVAELSDMYLLQGLSYCNLKEYAAAEDAYNKAIAYSSDFRLLYVLRGQVRLQQGDQGGAQADFAAARTEDLGPEFAAWVAAGAEQAWTCETLLEYQPAND